MENRNYQERDQKTIKEEFKKHQSVVYTAPTGSGKTYVCSNIVVDLVENNRILVLAHRKKLLDQMESSLAKKGINTGMLVGKIEKNMDSKVIIASVHTATRDERLKELLKERFDYIIVDEAHRIASASYDRILQGVREINPDAKLFGLTATPTRRDRKDLSKYFDVLIESENIATLIANGHLAKYRVFATPVIDLDQVDKNSSDYKIGSLSTYMKEDRRIKYAVESYKQFGEDRQVLIFCVDKSHAKKILEEYKANGYDMAYIDGETTEAERERIFSEYEAGNIRGIVSIETLIEGVDLPETKCVQFNRPTKSLTLYMQMGGRGLRKKKDGSDLIILDNAGCTAEFGTLSSPKNWSLDPTVDPSSPAKKNRVVARRKDGTYEEDLDKAEFLELEEMTPEEFAEKVLVDLEAAKTHNLLLERKQKEEYLALVKGIFTSIGFKDEQVKIDSCGISSSDYVTLRYVTPDMHHYEFAVHINLLTLVLRNNDTRRTDSFKDAAVFSEIFSKFYKFYSDDKKREKIVARYTEIKTMTDDKIDISELHAKQKQNKEKIIIDKVNERLAAGESTFQVSDERVLKFNRIYPSAGWHIGKEQISKIVMTKKQLSNSNGVQIYATDGAMIYETKSMKLDKFMADLVPYVNI